MAGTEILTLREDKQRGKIYYLKASIFGIATSKSKDMLNRYCLVSIAMCTLV